MYKLNSLTSLLIVQEPMPIYVPYPKKVPGWNDFNFLRWLLMMASFRWNEKVNLGKKFGIMDSILEKIPLVSKNPQ